MGEGACASHIHSHVILEALAEEVRGSMLFTTFLPLPCGQRFLHAANALVEMTRNRECVPYSFAVLKDDGTTHAAPHHTPHTPNKKFFKTIPILILKIHKMCYAKCASIYLQKPAKPQNTQTQNTQQTTKTHQTLGQI
jgi:hypothetical protein